MEPCTSRGKEIRGAYVVSVHDKWGEIEKGVGKAVSLFPQKRKKIYVWYLISKYLLGRDFRHVSHMGSCRKVYYVI